MSDSTPEPVLRSGRREAILVFVVWMAALGYSISYCYVFGYNRTLTDLRFVFGIPRWVFWGVVVPWTLCVAFSWWFSFLFMSDDQLPDEATLRVREEPKRGGD